MQRFSNEKVKSLSYVSNIRSNLIKVKQKNSLNIMLKNEQYKLLKTTKNIYILVHRISNCLTYSLISLF